MGFPQPVNSCLQKTRYHSLMRAPSVEWALLARMGLSRRPELLIHDCSDIRTLLVGASIAFGPSWF